MIAVLPDSVGNSTIEMHTADQYAAIHLQFRMYGHGVYTATKYAVQGIAECLRLELSPYQIRVNLVCPGIVLPLFEEGE